MMGFKEMAKNRIIRTVSNLVEGRSGEQVTVGRISIGKSSDVMCWCCMVSYKSDFYMDWFVSGSFNEWGDPEIERVDYTRPCFTQKGLDLVSFSISKNDIDLYLFRD